MPRYFFHLHNHLETRDAEGLELPDLVAARAVAERECRAVAAQNVSQGQLVLSNTIEVTDAEGKSLLKVRFGDVVDVTP